MKTSPSRRPHNPWWQAPRLPAAALCALLSASSVGSAQPVAPTVTPLGSFSSPAGGPVRVAADPAGRIYAIDPAGGRVAVLDAFGRAVAVKSRFARPLGIAVDPAGNIYLGEEGTGSVSVFDAQWNALGQLGAGPGEFAMPAHIAPDPASAGRIYVCDSGANLIKVYRDRALAFAFDGAGTGGAPFNFPSGVFASPAGEVFVVDQNNGRVQVFAVSDDAAVFQRGFALKAAGLSGRAQAIAADHAGRLYVADVFQGFVKIFGPAGEYLGTLGAFGKGEGQLRSPAGLAVDPFGRLLVASANNSRIELFGIDSFIHFAATPIDPFLADNANVVLSVTVSGSGPFTYQWRRGSMDLQDGGAVAGATSSQLILSGAAPADSGDYSVVVTGPNGPLPQPVTSLTLLKPPALASQPESQTVRPGATVVFAVSVSGDNLRFQWQRNGVDIPGATASSLTISDAQAEDAGRYALRVTNALGSITSETARLHVLRAPGLLQIAALADLPDGTLQMLLRCEPGFNYLVEASPDLVEWSPLGVTVGDTVPVEYLDPEAPGLTKRFYRLRWLPDAAPE